MTTQGRPPSEPTRPGPTGASPSTPASTPGITDRVQNTAGRAVDTVQETARPVVDKATDTAQQVAQQATEQVTSRLDMAVDYAADTLTGVAQALRQTGQHLREEGSQPMIAGYADSGATQVERLGGYLRQHDATEILNNVEIYARRNPMTFAGGAFALGLLAARFFRASGQRPHTPPMRTGAGYGASYGTMPPPRPPLPRPAPAPTGRFDAANPPGYSGAAPAARPIPSAPGVTPPVPSGGTATPGLSPTSREAERLTPVPGGQSGLGTTPPTGGGASTGGTTAPGAAPTSRPASPPPSREGGTTGGMSPGSDRPGSGSQRQV